jgi:putative nucleotidyltransferase with HDIG domain
MSRSLKLYIAGLVAASAIALLFTSFVFARDSRLVLGVWPDIAIGIGNSAEGNVAVGVAFWTLVTLFAQALPVRMPRGTIISVAIAPIIASMALGGPLAAAVVATVGTTELREVRRRIPALGTAANHAGIALPTLLAGWVVELIRPAANLDPTSSALLSFTATMAGGAVLFVCNIAIVSGVVALRTGQPLFVVIRGDIKGFGTNLLALMPLSWLMSRIFLVGGGWWATLLFALPLYTTRVAHHRFVEMREMFTQTIGALAEAVDKRDPFTSKHSHRVKAIAVDIGREMSVSEAELEALEWGGLLHDVGKIGVPDAVLLKQERLTREERMIMNAHPVLGAQIIAPVTKLAPELPIIRHHHEWYNGSGYPDRLIGDEIPKLARILHVADAFEAMTAARPYRMTPLTPEQALAELRKFAGVQFDPVCVDAFVKTDWVEGVPDAGRRLEPRPIPLIAQAASRMTQATATEQTAARAGAEQG